MQTPTRSIALALLSLSVLASAAAVQVPVLLRPDAPEMNRRAPDVFRVRLATSRGPVVIEVRRAWAPHGADRFFNLVAAGYYDDSRFFRIRKGVFAQFGIAADPKVSQAWRERTIPDDPFVQTNARGTVAFAFAVPDGRATQVFINLQDNAATHDKEPFVPFGRVVEGMEVADALYSEYRRGVWRRHQGRQAGAAVRTGQCLPRREFSEVGQAREGDD